MTQSQFLYKLTLALGDLPDEEKLIITTDYTQFFEEQKRGGASEEEIISTLASPEEIASSYKSGNPLPISGVRSIYDASDDGGGATPLSVLKFICLIPAAIVYLPVTVLLGLTVLLVDILLCVLSVCASVLSFASSSLQTGFILTGIGGILFTFGFALLAVIIFKKALSVVLILPEFMGRVLKNKRKAGHYR